MRISRAPSVRSKTDERYVREVEGGKEGGLGGGKLFEKEVY